MVYKKRNLAKTYKIKCASIGNVGNIKKPLGTWWEHEGITRNTFGNTKFQKMLPTLL
jgi:hypothetical protein